jgi:hypothetical protein
MVRSFVRAAAVVLVAAGLAVSPAAGVATATVPVTTVRAVNLPPDHKVLFYLGQDSTTLHAFKSDVLDRTRRFPVPAGVTLYTNLVGSPMSGMFQPTNYGSGENNFVQTLNEFGGGLAVGLYLVDPDQTPLKALAGFSSVDPATVASYRQWLDEFLSYLKSTHRAVFVRVGYEFDGPWNSYDPTAYKAAFRYISTRIHQLHANRVATVWQTAAWPETGSPAGGPYDATAAGHWQQWYPGDKYVDWAGMSYFYGAGFDQYQWACQPQAAAETPQAIHTDFLNFARAHHKPVFVAESAPQGFDLGNDTAACIFAPGSGDPQTRPVSDEQIWDSWYAPYFNFIEGNRDVIRAVSYINTDWASQPMWQCTASACLSGYWGDSSLQHNPTILARFRAEIAKPIFVSGPRAAPRFVAPNYSPPGRSEAEYADLPDGGTTGIAIADPTASNGRSALIYANGARMAFYTVARGSAISIRYATTTEDVSLSVLVNGRPVQTLSLPNVGSATNWQTVTVPAAVPNKATVTLRLNSGNVVWIDYITPGQAPGHR